MDEVTTSLRQIVLKVDDLETKVARLLPANIPKPRVTYTGEGSETSTLELSRHVEILGESISETERKMEKMHKEFCDGQMKLTQQINNLETLLRQVLATTLDK